MCKLPLKSINRRQMNLVRRQTIVPDIDYTITKMEFASINIRLGSFKLTLLLTVIMHHCSYLLYRVGQIKRRHCAYLLVTNECICQNL